MKSFLNCLVLFFLTTNTFVLAQKNIIKNGDFEVTNPNYSCHYSSFLSPQFYLFNGPIQFLNCPNYSSPDYFNSCVVDTTGNNFPGIWSVSVPYNLRCYQNAKSGSGYVGLLNWAKLQNEREYLTMELKGKLKYHTTYYFEIGCNQSAWHGYFSNDIAAFFHDTLIYLNTINALEQLTPQIVNQKNIIDTLNWISFGGIYQASGGENYITIGNFKNYLNNPDTIKNPWWNLSPSWLLNDPNNWDKGNYILLDDAWLIELPEISVHDSVKICSGDSTSLITDTAGLWTGISPHWEPSIGLNNPNVFNPIAFPNQTTTYFLTLQDTGRFANALAGIIDSITVVVNSDFKNISLSNDTLVCVGDTLLLIANCVDCGAVSYQWQPNHLFVDSNANPAILVAATGAEVTVNLESNGEKVCVKGTQSIKVSLKNEEECDEIEIIIPNLLTAGNSWVIAGLENPKVSIWDARGSLVYFSSDYKNDFVAKEANGMYFYSVLLDTKHYSGKLIISKD